MFYLNLKHNIKKEQSSLNAFHYLTRTAHFENQKDNEKLEFIRYGNMPKWAENKPKLFGKVLINLKFPGRTSSTLTIALPKELIREQRAELVQKLIDQFADNINFLIPRSFIIIPVKLLERINHIYI